MYAKKDNIKVGPIIYAINAAKNAKNVILKE